MFGDGLTRRQILKLSGAAVVGGKLIACGGSGAEPAPDDGGQLVAFPLDLLFDESDLYPLGVQAGAMTPTSAILWTYDPSSSPLVLHVWRDAEEPGYVYMVKQIDVRPEGGYAKVRVNGLGPGHYHYAFMSERWTGQGVGLPRRGPIGHFRTAFDEDDVRPLRIAGLTCSSLRNAPFVALDIATEARPDIVLHMGDMSYNDSATTLFEYRQKWRETLSQPEYRGLLGTAGFYMTWDDHEIDNDYNPERMAVEDPRRLADAKAAFFETLAVDRGENDRLWRSYRWGKTAEIFVVDSRSERMPSTAQSDDPIYISRRQMDWLKRGLVHSEARYKIVMNSVPMTEMAEIWNFGAFDRWEGYRRQRDELVGHLLDNDVNDVLFLSGDFHCGFVGRLDRKGEGRRYWEIAVGPTANGPNPLPLLAESGDLPEDEIFPRDQFVYYSGSDAAMTLLDLDAEAGSVRVKYVDARAGRLGEVLFDADLSTL